MSRRLWNGSNSTHRTVNFPTPARNAASALSTKRLRKDGEEIAASHGWLTSDSRGIIRFVEAWINLTARDHCNRIWRYLKYYPGELYRTQRYLFQARTTEYRGVFSSAGAVAAPGAGFGPSARTNHAGGGCPVRRPPRYENPLSLLVPLSARPRQVPAAWFSESEPAERWTGV